MLRAVNTATTMKAPAKSFALALAAALTLASGLPARASDENKAVAMITDVVIARPAGLGILLLGSAAFVVSYPFTKLSGNVDEARKTLVEAPYKITFKRKLGARDVE